MELPVVHIIEKEHSRSKYEIDYRDYSYIQIHCQIINFSIPNRYMLIHGPIKQLLF